MRQTQKTRATEQLRNASEHLCHEFFLNCSALFLSFTLLKVLEKKKTKYLRSSKSYLQTCPRYGGILDAPKTLSKSTETYRHKMKDTESFVPS